MRAGLADYNEPCRFHSNCISFRTTPQPIANASWLRYEDITLAVFFNLAEFAAASSVFITPLFLFSFGNHRRYRNMMPVPVHCHIGYIGGAHVAFGSGNLIFHPDFDSSFHRSIECAIDGRTQDQQVTYVHGREKIKVLDAGGYHITARVPMASQGAGEIDEVHQPSAEQIAQRVGVVGQNDLYHL